MGNEVYSWVPYPYASVVLIQLETPINKNATNIVLYLRGTNQGLLKGKYIQMCLPVIHLSVQV